MLKKAKINTIIVRCPTCGKIHAVSKEKTTWKCRCKLLGKTGRTKQHSVQETKLEDQTSLILECGVTSTSSQGIQAAYCDELEQVTIKGYQVISAEAFQDCTALRTVTLCNGVEVIEARAFAGCSSLEKIVLPEGLKYIGASAFEGSGLKSIIFPNSVTEIASKAFAGCTDLEEIVLPEKLERIGLSAFQGTGLKEIVLPEGLEQIGPSAFQKTGLKSIIFPDSVRSIGENAFANCHALEKAVLPIEIATVKEGTFQKSGLKEIIWTGNIKLIDSRAFAKCPFLEEIFLPEGLEQIGENAFQKSGLKRVTWADSVWNVHPDAFNGCVQLEEIRISPKASIHFPFAKLPKCPLGDAYLAQHTREDGIVEIHTCLRDGVLKGEKGTSLVCYPAPSGAYETFPPEVDGTFAYLPEITEVCFESGTRSIDEFMFRGCRHLKQLTLPWGLKKIGEGAFADCTDLEEVVIPESVVEIAPFAFGKCTSLRIVKISESLLKKLDHSVFALTPFAKNMQHVSTKPWRNILIVGLGSGAGQTVSWIGNDIKFRQDTLALDTAVLRTGRYKNPKSKVILLGEAVCHGKSAEGDPALGKAAIQENQEEICRELQEHDFVIVVARLGGGTGSGGAPVLVQWLQELNIPHLVVTSIPQPFPNESKRRILQARRSILEMKEMGTALLVISNQWVRRDPWSIDYDFSHENRIMSCIVESMTELVNLTELNVSDLYHADSMVGNTKLAYVCYSLFYRREHVEEIVGKIKRLLPHINIHDFVAYFLTPYDMDPKDVDYAEKMIRNTLPAKTNLLWSVVSEKRHSGVLPCVLFIITEDDPKALSLDSNSIILETGYPVFADDKHMW